ncbi:MAG: S41 family peptidase [Chitinophagaceae bacterium]|nr:S41 family peptidase [Chitinophagaceae bacterium]MCB9045549.1 S41 family peptidase [Chitinophagales bacterium]
MSGKDGKGIKVWIPMLFAITLIAGMSIGFKLRDSLRNKRDITTIIQRNDRLEQIIDLINARYVDSVNANLLYEDAVNGIIRHLDPHTVYIPADKLQSVNEELEGSFFGIGVEFSIVKDTIQITSVIEGGPAEVAGIQIGDRLIKVGDSVVAGTGITSTRIIKMLKGKQFSKVFLTMMDPVRDETRVVSLKRDEIPKYSIEAGVMLDSVTGIIKITRFSATTYDEFEKVLADLKKQGMKKLIVDLRQNSGGYMEPAKQIADEFLSGDKLIVMTRGMNSMVRKYIAGNTGGFEDGELAILVDEQSASASEILAGAIQDWDRGVIIGRRTFGKGLVQDQFDLEDGSALRLTIAKYYTPSGRSVQRSFENGREAYNHDFMMRYESGELTGYDTLSNPDTTKYYTANNRVVYGGGGITPDVYVPYDTTKLSTSLLNLIFSDNVKAVVWDYYINNRTSLKQYRTVRDFGKAFSADTLVQNYINRQDRQTKKVVEMMLKKERYRSFFALQMKAQLARMLFRDNGYYSISYKDDNMVAKALEIFNSNVYSTIVSR